MSRRTLLTAAVVAASLLAAACSDDGTDTVATGPDVTFATNTTAAATDTTDVPDTTPSSEPTTEPATTAALAPDAVVFTEYARGLTAPVDVAWRTDDPTLYVVQQDGLIVPLVDGVAGAPVLDVTDAVEFGGEQGLLGLAFHPTEPLAYVNYTRSGDGATVIEEFAVGADGVFDAASGRELLTIDQPYANHNGGDLTFGPDGYLYIGTGDGGAGGDPERRALNVGQLLGKILRIDVAASADLPYTIPADNPFVGVEGARGEIWSVGVRNPWRFNFDPATGDLWIGEVGQGEWEEIDLVRAIDGGGRGVNFGWSAWEGTHPFNDDQSPDGATPPIFEYPHGDQGCSVSGGTVYRGSAIPSLAGWYLFSDYCSGIINALQATDGVLTGQLRLGTLSAISAIGDGPDGELYVLSVGTGVVFRIDPA
ncbi:MAG: PQQ-dependent sugar dehydrogenase [Ilumatobacteraceae bacterium]